MNFNQINPFLLRGLQWWTSFLFIAVTLTAGGQPNFVPARLAIVVEDSSAATAGDVLTAELSKRTDLQLLERAEVEKIYREQGLSVANKDYLKLGQILGADGLLILSVIVDDTNQVGLMKARAIGGIFGNSANSHLSLDTRLIAVKPGVVLGVVRSAWSSNDSLDWAQGICQLFAADFPKLRVMAKDAIPISIVNLRSSIQSTAALEQEQQLKLLTIQRLSREPRLFVLERQQMQLLTDEKDLKADESPFWNGSYLLEGVVDQNGYSPQTVIINARLNPPHGGGPLLFEVSGSRTNLPQVINQLAVKVSEALQINSSVSEWNTADEAKEFLDEAQWALKWKIYSEAQAAAESAWALGKNDMDCAMARVRSYMVPDYRTVERGSLTITEVNPSRETLAMRPPGSQTADRARRALVLYLDYNRALPAGGVKPDSEWCRLGIENLISASRVLQHFYLVPAAQQTVGEKLVELRSAARTVAGSISQWPAVHDSYFVGDRIATHDELGHTIEENLNIYGCKLKWGCFWQERPEDAVALYRELLGSPVFCYLHGALWSREANAPRLIAWNDEDRNRIPGVWSEFVRELDASTNVLWRMEAKALATVEAANTNLANAAHDEWFAIIRSNREELVANNVELFYLGWRFAWTPETQAMDREYWDKTIPARHTAEAFSKQKKHLGDFASYDFSTFGQVFSVRDYSKAQAAELQPLIVAYKSNLLSRASTQTEKFRAQSDARWIEVFLEKRVNEILNPPAPPVANIEMSRGATPQPAYIAQPAVPAQKPPAAWTEGVTNALIARDYFRIPQELLRDTNVSGMAVTSYRWSEGRLLLGLRFETALQNYSKVSQAALAIFNSENGTWDIIKFPAGAPGDVTIHRMFPAEALFGFRGGSRDSSFELFRGDCYLSDGGEIKKFDFASRQWTILEAPENRESKFFAVEGRLLAANQESIFEITDAGHGSRILASTRRRPAVSVLDSWDDLGSPVLFPGPNHSLRAWIKGKVFIWKDTDWREEFAMNSSRPPEIFEDTVLARDMASLDGARFWALEKEQSAPDLCLLEPQRSGANIIVNQSRKSDVPARGPLWKNLEHVQLGIAPAASFKSNLYFLVDHPTIADGQHAVLICLVRGVPRPFTVPITFDAQQGRPPISAGTHGSSSMTIASWLCFSGDRLFLGSANTPGVWAIPVSKIEAAVATQKQALPAKKQSLNNP